MKEVRIDLGQRAYSILIGPALLKQVGELVTEQCDGHKALVVTDQTVGQLYAHQVVASLEQAGLQVTLAQLPDGEQIKTLAFAQQLYDQAFNAGLDRSCPVVALGGGVVGDLAGFVAATYMRGVPLVQLPTTVLAQVDSSVGGKVAVNHPQGKNIIGSFYQPRLVVADTGTLNSLVDREIKAGLAEVIKYGVIYDGDFFNWLEQNISDVLALKDDALTYVIARSCQIKAEVVEKDETEQGLRAILNYGHTAGHAIESLTGYGQYRHGEAVAIGMVMAAKLAVHRGLLSADDVERIMGLIKRTSLPNQIPSTINEHDFQAAIAKDKKVYHGQITFVLPTSVGQVSVFNDLTEPEINQAFSQCRA